MAPVTMTPSLANTPGNRKKTVTTMPSKRFARAITKTPVKEKADPKHKDTVGVYLRLRPLKLDEPTLVKIDDQQVKAIPPDGSNEQVFSFTQVFESAPQSELFDKVARPVVEDFITSGKDGLIFTYGITGSGKTYTMEGLKSDPGLIYRTIDFVFNSVGSQQTRKNLIESDGHNSYRIQEQEQLYPNLNHAETQSAIPSVVKWQNRNKETASVCVDPTAYYCIFISLIELYNKQVHDLFEDFDTNSNERDKKRREIRTDQKGMSYVANAVEIEVKSADEAVELYTRGVKRRKTGSTALNQESSRGHCVLNLKLVHVRKNYRDEFDEDTLVSSQLCLVDLAGSERAKRSGATGEALQEAGSINNSLGALRKCIRALRDREPTATIKYREYSLTRLFKSYFEGHGSVCMVLCVKPTSEDFQENNLAMQFGFMTQEVAVDYASPRKILKRSKSRNQDLPNYEVMYEYLDRKSHHFELNPELSDEQFISSWIDKLKTNREKRKKCIETAIGAQNEVRQNILATVDRNTSLRQHFDSRMRDIRNKEEQLDLIESKLNSTERSREHMTEKIKLLERQIRDLDSKNKATREKNYYYERRQAQDEKLFREIEALLQADKDRSDTLRRVVQLMRKVRPTGLLDTAAPSAPEMEPLQSSSPVGILNPSTSEMSESNTPATTTESSDAIEFHHEHHERSPVKTLLSSPTNGGVPIVNPRYNRSLSCSSMQWIHHKPAGTIDTGTVLKPKLKNGRSVKVLQSSDILRKDAAGYSVVHQDADSNGDVETSIYKGHIISTVCGGAQVILNDVETMRQASPKRKRAASDAQFTR